MPNAPKLLIATASLLAFAGCQRTEHNAAANQDMSVDGNLSGQLPANAEIETLPPDESSETSSGELNAGDDGPDVNEPATNH